MHAATIVVLALAVAAVQAGGYGRSRHYDSVKEERLPTIYKGNRVHKSASSSLSRSRHDSYSKSESESLVNKRQKVVKSDTYIHRDTLVYKPLKVHHHHHHHQTDIVKKIQPVQNNEWIEEKQKVIEPEEAQINTYSKSIRRETVVNPTIVNNAEKFIRLKTEEEPTKWVNVGGYEGGSRGGGNREGGSYGKEEYDR